MRPLFRDCILQINQKNMYKNLALVLLTIISIQLTAQNKIISKDIADIVQPNPEVELFYGNAQYSADKIVILPEHIIVYDAFTATFHLLDKETRLSLGTINLFKIKGINTHRVNFIDEKGKTFLVLKTPFKSSTSQNMVNMHSLSDTSVYGGLIKVKRDYKVINLFVKNDSLILGLINFDTKNIYKQLTKEQKRKENLRFNNFSAIKYKNYVSSESNSYINLNRSPYCYKKSIKYEMKSGYIVHRDSLYNFNCIYYRKHNTDSLKLLYQNSYTDVLKLKKYKKSGFWLSNSITTSKNKLIYYSNSFDSLIVFNEKHDKIFVSQLFEEASAFFKDFKEDNYVKAWGLYYFKILKDEFTEQLYINIPYKGNTNIIAELNINYETQKPEFKFLRKYKISNARFNIETINKGVLYISTTNSLVGNKYIYKYDIYKGLKNKEKLLNINFYAVNNLQGNNKKKHNWVSNLDKYNKPEPLSKKDVKKYFGKIKKDTLLYSQSTQLNTIKSIIECVENDSLNYAFAHLFMYANIIKLEIEDDVKSKNFQFFDDLIEDIHKPEILERFNYILNTFEESDKELYNHNKIAIKTPNGMFYYMYRKNDLWYLDSAMRRIVTDKE